jgi:hypothetical protein
MGGYVVGNEAWITEGMTTYYFNVCFKELKTLTKYTNQNA